MEKTMEISGRVATLKLSQGDTMPVLSARVPSDLRKEEFGFVAASAYDVISKLTGHPCMSGRIKFVVEDMFLNDITRVDLKTGRMG
jgi:hypothetical protein